MNATEKVADYVTTFHYDRIPSEVVLNTKHVILDELGVLLRASKSNGASELIVSFISKFGGKGKCTVVGSNLKVDPINAALANGTLGHDIIELDDVHNPSTTHAAGVIVPAALAVAELEKASGKAFITAIVSAYDIEGRIGIAFGPVQRFRGFHRTSVCGCFGAAIAAAKLLGLNREAILNALGSAGSQASGLMAFQDEAMHMNKSLQSGIAARNGVTAALLAQMGFLAPPQILDGRNNILRAFSEEQNFAALTEELGSRFEIMRTGLKKYSCCRIIHAPLEAFLKILDERLLSPELIGQVTVKLGGSAASAVDGHPLVTHNAQKVLAVAAFDRRNVTVMQPYSEFGRSDPKVLALSKRIKVVRDSELEKLSPVHAAGPAIVEVETKDGRVFAERVSLAKGEPSNPLDEEEIEAKFINLATQVIREQKARVILNTVLKLEELADIRELTSLLTSSEE